MTESLTFPNSLVENHDTIFYNIVGNFIPPEWRSLSNNCGKRLSTTSRQLLSLIVYRLQVYNPKNKPSEELQEGYHFFEKELGVCQRRVRQCLRELKTSGFIDFTLITTIKYNIKCRNILCIKPLKKFINFRKANDSSCHFNHTNSQSRHQKISIQPEGKSNPSEKKFPPLNIIDNNISLSISRCEKNQKNGEQILSESESTEEKSLNLPTELTVSSVDEALSYNSTDDNSGDVSLTDDKSDSDSDSTGESSGNSGEQESNRQLSSWLSNIAKKAKSWYPSEKLERFYPLTESDAALLRMRTGRDFNLSFINKLLEHLSEKYPNNRFPCKQAVLKYMQIALVSEMRQVNLVNSDNFNFKMDAATMEQEAIMLQAEKSLDTSPRSMLKRKIAGGFERDIVCTLLTSCRFIGAFGNEYRILTDTSLSNDVKGKLLDIVQNVYGNQVELLHIISNKTATTSSKSASVYSGLKQLNPQSVWYKIREYLLKSRGEAIDKSWFSQLEAIDEDVNSKKITLRPATAFVGAWIKNNYWRDLSDACSSQNFTFEIINAGRMAAV